MSDAIVVQSVDYAAPMILANSGFLQTLATVEAQVKSLTITDAASAQTAADIQSRLTTAAKTLDTQRMALNKPFNDQITAINTAAKGPANRIQQAKDTVSKALTAFAVEQQRLEREAQAKIQAQLKALQEQAEQERIAAEAENAKAAAASDEDWGTPEPVVKTDTEKAIEAVKYAAPVAVARPSGVTIRTRLLAVVEDMSKLPDMFIEKTVKQRALESTFCAKWREGDPMPVCAGVKFTVDKMTVSTGR